MTCWRETLVPVLSAAPSSPAVPHRHSKKTVNIPDYCKNSRYDTTLTCPTSTNSSVAGSAPSPSVVGSLQRNYSFYNHRLDQLFFFV
ncbi:unnamed protein product [Macrosiphum euphorbiae]|uniref:Uncharacterized protein n=1 Tax=Macrosiphum euphorbiae TaxID=13131 RepID=A0AAV0WLP3_9HEMI|nr:unnamed protein product [Macrosiphum euphorbiae]